MPSEAEPGPREFADRLRGFGFFARFRVSGFLGLGILGFSKGFLGLGIRVSGSLGLGILGFSKGFLGLGIRVSGFLGLGIRV